ncbi:MAG: hypothetical protein OEM38_08940 [Gammaproteobacteria bacterium]|nr:hypothetical protein [Gammaproteobacteria bacterium]
MKYVANLKKDELSSLLNKYGIELILLSDMENIPGSYWGAPEAGIIKNQLYVRSDTPVHSALHESCHFICMDDKRRQTLHTDTGGDYDEENAVCYLQIILADFLSGIGRHCLCEDMDEWGYTFRLGSAKKWFDSDAEDALQWLISRQLLSNDKIPTWIVNN